MASQSIPVDVSRFVFVAMGSPRPKVRDRATGEVATDRDGRPITVLSCAWLDADESSGEDGDLQVVQTLAEVPSIRRGAQVMLQGLEARPYSFRDEKGMQRSGVAFWAAAIVPVGRGASA